MCSHVCSQSTVTAKTERKMYLEVLCQDDRDVDSKKNENEQMRGPTITRRGVMGPQTLLRKKRDFLSLPAPATWVLTGPPWVLTVPSLGAHGPWLGALGLSLGVLSHVTPQHWGHTMNESKVF